MNHEPTFYETLGVSSTAATSAIRQAHRKLAQQSHPDKVQHLLTEFPWLKQEAALRYERLTQAFNVLNDETARRRYDAELNAEPNHKWPDFVSRYAPPICDPVSHFHNPLTHVPTAQASPQESTLYARGAEAVAQRAAKAQRILNRRFSVQSPFRNLDPRAEKSRMNFFASTLAFIALMAVIYATTHYQQLDQKTSAWLMQQGGGPNPAMQVAPGPGSAIPFGGPKDNFSKFPPKSPVKPPNTPTPTNQSK